MVRLRRYWLPATKGFGIGVTTVDRGAARIIAERALHRLPAGAELTGEIIEDVDIRKLDAEHVRTRMGSPDDIGIWFP